MRDASVGSTPAPLSVVSRTAFYPAYLGITLILLWNQCVLYAQRIRVDDGISTIEMSLVRCLCIVILAIVVMRPSLHGHLPRWWEIASVALMTLGSLLFMIARTANIATLDLPAIICCGVGITWGAGVWFEFYMRLGIRDAFAYAMGSMGVASLAGIAFCFIPASVSYTVAILLPMASYVAYRQSMVHLDTISSVDAENHFVDHVYDNEPHSTTMRLIIGIALFSFVLGVSRGFPNGKSIELPALQRVLQYVLTAAVIAFAMWFLFKRNTSGGAGGNTAGGNTKPHISVAWQTLIVLMFIGVVLLAVPSEKSQAWGGMLISTVNLLQVCLLWLLAYDTARFVSHIPACVVLGFYWLLHLFFREAGRLTILLVGPHVTNTQNIIVAGLVFLLAIIMGFLLTDRIPKTRPFFDDFNKKEGVATAAETTAAMSADQETTRPAVKTAMDSESVQAVTVTEKSVPEAIPNTFAPKADPFAHMCETYSLTNRELDVARLLAQGRSSTYIANELILSPETVRGYVKSIYAKTDVHSKQQFIDLVNSLFNADTQ